MQIKKPSQIIAAIFALIVSFGGLKLFSDKDAVEKLIEPNTSNVLSENPERQDMVEIIASQDVPKATEEEVPLCVDGPDNSPAARLARLEGLVEEEEAMLRLYTDSAVNLDDIRTIWDFSFEVDFQSWGVQVDLDVDATNREVLVIRYLVNDDGIVISELATLSEDNTFSEWQPDPITKSEQKLYDLLSGIESGDKDLYNLSVEESQMLMRSAESTTYFTLPSGVSGSAKTLDGDTYFTITELAVDTDGNHNVNRIAKDQTLEVLLSDVDSGNKGLYELSEKDIHQLQKINDLKTYFDSPSGVSISAETVGDEHFFTIFRPTVDMDGVQSLEVIASNQSTYPDTEDVSLSREELTRATMRLNRDNPGATIQQSIEGYKDVIYQIGEEHGVTVGKFTERCVSEADNSEYLQR